MSTEIRLVTDTLTDGSHPTWGNLVLVNEGRAAFGGVWYVREDRLDQQPPEHADPTLADFKPGDRVVVTSDVFADGGTVPVGSFGVVESIGGFYASILIDGGGRWSFAPDEIAHSDEPIPRVYMYPEGLYKDPRDGDRVFIRHEDSEGGYEITYLDGGIDSTDAPVNHDMTADIVASYTLVAPA